MRRLVVIALLLAGACEEDEGPQGIAQCVDCEQDMTCPETQPGINPLVSCDTVDAQCFYCGEQMRRFVCQGAAEGDNDLRWRDNGVAEMCPAPSMDTGETN